jgi:hypothetical protein
MRMYTTKAVLALAAGIVAALAVTAPAGAAPVKQPGAAVGTSTAKAPAPARSTQAGSKLGAGARTQHLDGVCGTGDLCMWYFAGFQGSAVDLFFGDDTLWDNTFLTAGSGLGSTVANNSESAWNYDPSYTAWTCSGTFQTGDCGWILPNSGGDFLIPTYYNNVESIHWVL